MTARTRETPPYTPPPPWARAVAADAAGGLNVAAVRARTAETAAIAPFDVAVELADGSTVVVPALACDVSPTGFRLRVKLPV